MNKAFIQIPILVAIIISITAIALITTGVILVKSGKLSFKEQTAKVSDIIPEKPINQNFSLKLKLDEVKQKIEDIEEEPEVNQAELELNKAKIETERAKQEAEKLRGEAERLKIQQLKIQQQTQNIINQQPVIQQPVVPQSIQQSQGQTEQLSNQEKAILIDELNQWEKEVIARWYLPLCDNNDTDEMSKGVIEMQSSIFKNVREAALNLTNNICNNILSSKNELLRELSKLKRAMNDYNGTDGQELSNKIDDLIDLEQELNDKSGELMRKEMSIYAQALKYPEF